ncbi:hypothetical protein R77567_01629 [Ralstonia sp. LMG 32965]|uniref:Uncharacterized protein n=1 Tax=Ralstonia flatus TaxID=3058601 RepID=A0AAD2BWA2_9RALS|nr:hypothetical protein [Ralstonia sp. LMG 32965]MBN6211443.1 hypothetical protein [Ralstonia pickettii]CAJ0862229.1 hypothetical protein R77567_01629 [Ralstonia sp. LMG 32965]
MSMQTPLFSSPALAQLCDMVTVDRTQESKKETRQAAERVGATTKFGSWVVAFGIARLAGELKVTNVAIYQHLRAEFEPRPKLMRAYVHIAAGAITMQDIHDHIDQVRAAQRSDEQ